LNKIAKIASSKIQANTLIISLLFIAINALAVAFEQFYILLIPYLLLVIFLAIFHLNILMWALIFFVPLSIPLSEFSGKLGFDMNLPDEPILFGIMLLVLFRLLLTRNFISPTLAKHPVSLSIIFYLFWMFFTSLTSSLFLVSIKFFIAHLWFIISFYLIVYQMFTEIKELKKFVLIFTASFALVIFYTINRHFGYGLFDKQAAHFVMTPFFNDHTSYGAILAFFIPPLLLLSFYRKYSLLNRSIAIFFLLLFLFAIVLSYTRAAWGSLVAAFLVFLLMYFKVSFKQLFLAGIIVIGTLFSFQSEIVMKLKKNKQDSSADLSEHVKSMSNIASDASNLERLNRWKSALKMFAEKPILGWGPGTYMFQYAPFQTPQDKTIISTNAADGGNAHSEYIGLLAESGVLGTVSFLLIIIFTTLAALRTYFTTQNSEIKMWVAALFLGLLSYWIHATLNNFLDTDKASAPFWAFTAGIVMLDIKNEKIRKKTVGTLK